MKKLCLCAAFLLCFGLGLVNTREAYSAPQETVTLAEVLQKSAQAYDALQSYSGTTTVVGETVYTNPLIGERTLRTESDARIQFVRPNKIRIDGHTAGSGDRNPQYPFSIISDGSKTWSSWELNNEGKFEEEHDVLKPLSSMIGVAKNAATHISSILLKLDWGFPTRNMEGYGLKGHEVIDGVDCYKIVRKNSTATQTYWVDSKSFFLRQYLREQDEDQATNSYNALPEEIKARIKKSSGNLPESKTISSRDLHKFTIESTNATLDEKLFQNPTSQN